MNEQNNLEKYLSISKQQKDFCFFEKLNISEMPEYKKINELLPKIIKEKYLYSYYNEEKGVLSFSTYFSTYKGNISATHIKLKADGPKGGVVVLDIQQKYRDKSDLEIKNLFSTNLGEVKFFKENEKDKNCIELLENLKIIENKLKKEVTFFIEGESLLYSEYQKLEQEKEKCLDSFRNLILPKFLDETFLDSFIKELDKHFVTFLEKNLKFRIFFTDDFSFSDKHKEVIGSLKIHIMLSNFNEENYLLNSVNHAIGVLTFTPIDKQIGWECFCLDNIKYLKKKISVVKWCRNDLKKILIKNINFDELLNLKEI